MASCLLIRPPYKTKKSSLNNYNPETGEMDNNQPIKKWLKHKASEFFEDNQGDATYERVATVANWKKEAGRPRKN